MSKIIVSGLTLAAICSVGSIGGCLQCNSKDAELRTIKASPIMQRYDQATYEVSELEGKLSYFHGLGKEDSLPPVLKEQYVPLKKEYNQLQDEKMYLDTNSDFIALQAKERALSEQIDYWEFITGLGWMAFLGILWGTMAVHSYFEQRQNPRRQAPNTPSLPTTVQTPQTLPSGNKEASAKSYVPPPGGPRLIEMD